MKTITSILTFLGAAMLAVSACAPRQLDQTGATTPEATPMATAASDGAEITPEPVVTVPVVPTGRGQGTALTPAPIVTPTGPSTDSEQRIVTLADQGQTIQLAAGQSFLLKLGELYTWEVSVSDQTVVSRVRNIAVVRGAQGVYEAVQTGTVTMTAAGDPLCRQSKPACGMPSILFTVVIVVK